ncbi:MAG: hypothetical protein NUW37_17205 [Planctomycetes bacterium]|nr:hypothetical protein [Planctomycetota bacterium]
MKILRALGIVLSVSILVVLVYVKLNYGPVWDDGANTFKPLGGVMSAILSESLKDISSKAEGAPLLVVAFPGVEDDYLTRFRLDGFAKLKDEFEKIGIKIIGVTELSADAPSNDRFPYEVISSSESLKECMSWTEIPNACFVFDKDGNLKWYRVEKSSEFWLDPISILSSIPGILGADLVFTQVVDVGN